MENISDYNKLKKCKKKAEEKNDLKELANICNALGELLSENGYHEEAMAEHNMEKRVSEALQDKIGEAVACRKIGECLCKLGQFDKALRFQNQYLTLAQECNNKVEVQRALATLGNTYYTQADTQQQGATTSSSDQAERMFLHALRVCSELRGSSTVTESEYMAMKGRLFLNLGLVYDLRDAEKESTEYLQKALTIAKQWHLEEEQYLCHFNSATQALRRGQPAVAQQSLQYALTLSTKLHNKPRQKEIYCQLAIASVNAKDTKSSKHYLKKAYKLLPTAEESQKFVKLYKAVSAVEELGEQQSACNNEDSNMFSIHEKLGDAFTEIGSYCGSYAIAIQHYQAMVQCGEGQGLGADKLIPAYVSLAQTYADNRQPQLAITSYLKEIELRGDDHEQVCRTFLNIAELEERRGDGYNALKQTYTSAFTHAKKAKHPKLQVQVLRSLIATQEAFKVRNHQEQTRAKLKQVLSKYGLKGAGEGTSEEEEEEDSQSQDKDEALASDVEGDVSISDLTESDRSDEENVRPALSQHAGTTRVRRRKNFKKNEKGETPLHVACIKGNLKRVRTLLAEGHPVNERDNAGWTPLHEAARVNFLAVAEALIDAGADINDRGGESCDGVTPLIDAAANGSLDIVTLLVGRGVNVLAKDDKKTTAVQALHNWYRDHADTSNQELVAQYQAAVLLLQEKVSGDAARKTPSSNRTATPNRREVRDHDEPGPSSSTITNGSAQTSTQTPSREKHRSSWQNSRSMKSTAASRPLREDSASSNDEEEEVYANPRLEARPASDLSATETYRSSMQALGSCTQRAEVRASMSKPVTKARRSAPRPALIDRGEDVGDDWLIDDLQLTSRKRRDHSSLGGMLSSDSVRQAMEHKRARLTTAKQRDRAVGSSCDEDAVRVSNSENVDRDRLMSKDLHRESILSSQSSRHKRSSSMKFASPAVCRHSDSDCEEDEQSLPVLSRNVRRSENCVRQTHGVGESEDLAEDEEASMRLSGSQEEQGTLVSTPQPSVDIRSGLASSPAVAAVTPTQLSRVKVRIEGSVFLIPLSAAEEKTVGWLSEEASQRYSSHFGRRPFLTLSSSDGAILSTEDVLSAVLSKDEQLDGTVHGWDQASLSDRYAQACKSLNTVRYRNIVAILRETETSHHLSLSGLGLRSSVFLPITRALQRETTLTKLLLPDNRLGDEGLKVLASSLCDLRVLTHLSVSGNDVTAVGFRHLADLFPSTTRCLTSAASTSAPLQMLETLDIGHNPLGNSIADSLCNLVRCLPSLTALLMPSCGLTAKLFQHNRPALAACFQGSGVAELDVSHNPLGSLGVELLLWSVNAPQLTTLDLGHTCCTDHTSPHLARHLRAFLNQDSSLQSLSVENCSLNQEDVDFLCRLVEEVPSLQKLNISLNKAVTTDSLRRLLTRSAHSQLRHLQALSCSLTSPLSCPTPSTSSFPAPGSSFLEALRSKLSCACPLQYLSLCAGGLDKTDRQSLRDVWVERWAQANVQLYAQSLVLAVKHS